MLDGTKAAALLENAGLRPTDLRLRILSAILAAGASLSHRDLVDRMRGVDRVTIYRNLKLLKQSGLVHGVQGVDGVLRYLANPRAAQGCPGGHPHFLCTRCGKMSCLSDQELPCVSVPSGAQVEGKQFLVYGLCVACSTARR